MPAMQTDTTIEPSRVTTLHADHIALLATEASDEEVEAVLDRYAAELTTLAGTAATTLAQIQGKAAALETCVLRYRDRPAEIVGDCGLAASLVADLTRYRGG